MNTLTSKYMSGRLLLVSGMTGLIALTTLTAPAVQAQGLGGFLSKAKEKANQVTNGAGSATGGAGQTGNRSSSTGELDKVFKQAADLKRPGPNGDLPHVPDFHSNTGTVLTAEDEVDWANAIIANHRDRSKNAPEYKNADNYGKDGAYRDMRDKFNVVPKITWDPTYPEFMAGNGDDMFRYINSVFENFWRGIVYPNRSFGAADTGMPPIPDWDSFVPEESRFLGQARKINEIHFTTTTKTTREDDPSASNGWVMSWNQATMTLTMAVSLPYGARSSPPANFITFPVYNFIKANVK